MSLITRNAKDYQSMIAQIYLSGPFGIFCLYVILTLAGANNRDVIINYRFLAASSRPLFKQIENFSGILTLYFSCKYFP